MPGIDEEKAIRNYLLGELSEDERERLEKRLLADDGYFQQLLLVEEDLIDDYLVSELAPGERERFDGYFLRAPERQQQLRFAKAFKKYAASPARKPVPEVAVSPRRSSLQAFLLSLRHARPALLFAPVAILIIVISGFWFIMRQSQPTPLAARNEPTTPTPVAQPAQTTNLNSGEIATQASPTPAANNAKIELTPQPPTRNQSPKPSVLAVSLVSGLERGEGALKNIKLSPYTSVVRLQLELEPASSDYQSYRAVLQSGSDREVLSRSGLRARATAHGKTITLDVPARLLKRDDYSLKLSGQSSAGEFETAGAYSFQISK